MLLVRLIANAIIGLMTTALSTNLKADIRSHFVNPHKAYFRFSWKLMWTAVVREREA
jgi:hypothetical protein